MILTIVKKGLKDRWVAINIKSEKMDYNQRVIEVMHQQDMSASEFARKVGTTRQAVYNWKQGTHDVPVKYVIKIIIVFDKVDARWLITGQETGVTKEDEAYQQLLEENERFKGEMSELREQIKICTEGMIKTMFDLVNSKDEIIRLKS